MAKDKHSFLLYSDIYFTIKKLSDEQAGRLFKHILSYVNDENPIAEDILTDLVFEPIKQSLKRDLKKYEGSKIIRSIAGRLGGLRSGEVRRMKNEANEAKALKLKQNEANEAVSVSDSVSVIEEIKKTNLRKKFIPPTEDEVVKYFLEKGYKTETAKKAFLYYTEMNWHDSRGSPIKSWKGKMVAVWFKDENKTFSLKELNDERNRHKR